MILIGGGCGGSPASPAGPPALPIPPLASAPAPIAVERPEPPPAPPRDLVLTARIADPLRLLKDLVAIAPPGVVPNLPSPEQLVELAFGRDLADTIDLTQPVDLASLASDSIVVSLAVKGDAEGRLGVRPGVDEKNGLLFVKRNDGEPGLLSRMGACAFVPASRAAPTRLVCATETAGFEGAARWLARAPALDPADNDVRVSLPASTLRSKSGKGSSVTKSAGAKLGDAMLGDFLDDVAGLDLTLRFGPTHIAAGGTARFATRRSVFAKFLVPRTPPSTPVPAFFRLPSDTMFALSTMGGTADDLAPLRKVFLDDLDESLTGDGYPPEKIAPMKEKLEAMFFRGGPVVVGVGLAGGADRAERALGALVSAAKNAAKAEGDARAALVPWALFEFDEKQDAFAANVRALMKASDDADKARKPGSAAASTAKKDPDGDHVDAKIGALDPALKLPAATLVIDVTMSPRTKGKRPVRRAKIFVVPKGSSTWIGYSEDTAAIASKLRVAIDDTTEAGTLGPSKDAAELRSRRGVAHVLTSMRGIELLLAARTTRAELEEAARDDAKMLGLPTRGSGALTLVATSEQGPAGSAVLGMDLHAGRTTVTDVITLLTR